MNQPSLLPCPFCGNIPSLDFIDPEISAPELPDGFYAVSCEADCKGSVSFYGDSPKEAAAIWNKRAPVING